MTLTKADLGQFATSAENMSITLSYAEEAFLFMSRLHSDVIDNRGFEALCFLCGNGLKGVLEKDSETVERLVSHLRTFPQEVAS